jgi:hypothetical protein
MDGARDEVGSLLVVLLKPQVGMKEALQQLIAVRAQRPYIG